MPYQTHATSSGTVLVVDDQEKNVQVVGSTLTAFNYEIMVATSGEQALTRVEARVPDLILLDILMPDMDGFAVCAALKANPQVAEVPIIFLSANDDKNVIVRALEAGGVDFLTKPFNKAELIARVRTHLELKRTRDELGQLIAKREEFIGIMAHDLKNPIAGIQFSSTLLKEMGDKLPPPANGLAENIHEATVRATSLIEQFLNEIREARTDLKVNLKDHDLNMIIDESVDRFRTTAMQKSITLHWTKPTESHYAKVDRFATARILDNLISNAIKFTPQGKNVHLSLNPVNGEVSIIDEGPGIKEEDHPLLFQQFTRLSARPTGGETSTGLGLSIAHRLSELMNAELVCHQNGADEGAHFSVKFANSKSDSDAPV